MDQNGGFNSDDHYIYYYGQESLRRNGVAIIVNKRVQNAVLDAISKTTKWSLLPRQTIQYLHGNPSLCHNQQCWRSWSWWFYEDLQNLLELTQKRCPFHYRGLECKSRKSRDTWSNGQIWPWSTEWSRAKVNRVLPRECTVHSKHLEGLMLKLKLQYFGHLMQRIDSLGKILILGKTEGRTRRDSRGWDGWMASPTRSTWVWASSGSWWWTGKRGVLQSMGSQRVRYEWITELNH